MSEDKKESTTKLVLIDTKALKAFSYVGSQRGGEADLPDPDSDLDISGAELAAQLNAFREDADDAIYREKVKAEATQALRKRLMAQHEDYKTWFNLLVKSNDDSQDAV
jgi:hypothetical protein